MRRLLSRNSARAFSHSSRPEAISSSAGSSPSEPEASTAFLAAYMPLLVAWKVRSISRNLAAESGSSLTTSSLPMNNVSR